MRERLSSVSDMLDSLRSGEKKTIWFEGYSIVLER